MNSSGRVRAPHYEPGARVITPLLRLAVILRSRQDGLLEARYTDGDCSTVTLNPEHLRRSSS